MAPEGDLRRATGPSWEREVVLDRPNPRSPVTMEGVDLREKRTVDEVPPSLGRAALASFQYAKMSASPVVGSKWPRPSLRRVRRQSGIPQIHGPRCWSWFLVPASADILVLNMKSTPQFWKTTRMPPSPLIGQLWFPSLSLLEGSNYPAHQEFSS